MANEADLEYLPYNIVYTGGTGEIVEKKSRFIAVTAPAESETQAASFIEAVRKKYYDARHHCFAYLIGRDREFIKYSDDGEPGGTAGKPILEVLQGAEVTNTVLVVTRYFGGTLLGTGGLVRAYTRAAQAGLAASRMAVMRYGAEITVKTDYTDLGRIQYLLGVRKIQIQNSNYGQAVELYLQVPWQEAEGLIRELTQATAARARMEITGKGYYMEGTES